MRSERPPRNVPVQFNSQTIAVLDPDQPFLFLNHLLLFIAGVSSVLVLASSLRPSAQHLREWRWPAAATLASIAVFWIVDSTIAGFAGGVVWFLFILVPSIVQRNVTELILEQRFRAAHYFHALNLLLHPAGGFAAANQFQRALRFTAAGNFEAARQELALISKPTRLHEMLRGILAARSRQGNVDLGFAPTPRSAFRRRFVRFTPVVTILIALNALMFGVEMLAGGATDPEVLQRLGALEPALVILRGEYWRVLTALFLHYGLIHLLFNLYALNVLGPALERAMGAFRFAICYLIAGIGSSVCVVLFRAYGWITANQLVGASGAIMGVVGAWAGLLLRHRHMPMAGSRLRNILFIVVMQTAFDLATPQVSMAAHMSGLITGFIVGFTVAPRVEGLAR